MFAGGSGQFHDGEILELDPHVLSAVQLEGDVALLEAFLVSQKFGHLHAIQGDGDVVSDRGDEEIGPFTRLYCSGDKLGIRLADPGPHGGLVKPAHFPGIVDLGLEAPDTDMSIGLFHAEVESAVTTGDLEPGPDPEVLEALVGHQESMPGLAAG